MAIFFQIIVNGIVLSAIYALLSAGISFLYATSRIFHLAHGVVALSAGYVFWWIWIGLGLSPFFAVVIAIAVAALSGYLMNGLVYEPLRRREAKGLGYLIATLALLTLGTAIILGLFGAAPKTFTFQSEILDLGGVRITTFQIWLVIISALLLSGFLFLIKKTRFGKAMRATADNETVAEILGIDTKKIRKLAFIYASVLAAAAGILFGLEFNLDPNRGILLALFGFSAAVIGGTGSLGGAITGGFIIGLGEQIIVWFLSGGWRNAIVFVALFLFLLFKPSGIFGKKREI